MHATVHLAGRRAALRLMGAGAALLATSSGAPAIADDAMRPEAPEGAAIWSGLLATLARDLARAPRRRSFATVPFMIGRPELWDHEASAVLLSYKGNPSQVWEATDLTGPWLGLMREAMNGQNFAFGHDDFLAVAAVHGLAHLSLFDQSMWDKYALAASTGDRLKRNDLIMERAGVLPGDSHQELGGFYGPSNNNILSLQRRGAVFVACHDSIHAIARGLQTKQAPDGPSADGIAADLTNHLIQGAVLVPSVVAYLVELQKAGFTYAKGA